MDEQQQNEQELTKIIEYHYAEIRRLRGELEFRAVSFGYEADKHIEHLQSEHLIYLLSGF